MQEAELTPLAPQDHEDGVEKVENLGRVKNPQHERHASLTLVKFIAHGAVPLALVLGQGACSKAEHTHINKEFHCQPTFTMP